MNNKITNKTKQSNSAKITILPSNNIQKPPRILHIDSNITTLIGENVVLQCIASGWPLPSVQWLNSKGLVISNNTLLTLERVTADMDGYYNCTAFNMLGHFQKVYCFSFSLHFCVHTIFCRAFMYPFFKNRTLLLNQCQNSIHPQKQYV